MEERPKLKNKFNSRSWLLVVFVNVQLLAMTILQGFIDYELPLGGLVALCTTVSGAWIGKRAVEANRNGR